MGIAKNVRARWLRFHNTSILVLYVSAALITLEVVAFPSRPVGRRRGDRPSSRLRLANLIKDYFYGFMILLEDQYGVNDVVAISGITAWSSGSPADDGCPRHGRGSLYSHGQITTVSNLTHKWSGGL